MNGTFFIPVEADKVIGYLQNQSPVLRVIGSIVEIVDRAVNLLRVGCPSVQIICKPAGNTLDGTPFERDLQDLLDELELANEKFTVTTGKRIFIVTRTTK